MKQPLDVLDVNFFQTPSGKKAAQIIEKLKEAALADVRDPTNVHAPSELLQIALLATAAVNEVNEEQPSDFRDISPTEEFWPILFNEKVKLERYRDLRIGHDLLNSRNPKKRNRDLLWAFFAKEIVASLEACRIRACTNGLPPSATLEAMATHLIRKNRKKNWDELHPDFRSENIRRYQTAIAEFRPPWIETLGTLED